MSEDGKLQRLFDELQGIRQELHALREDFEQRGLKEVLDERVSQIEVEQRLWEIEQEVIKETEEAKKKASKRGLWKRR